MVPPSDLVIVVGSINVDVVVRVPRLPRAGETVTGGRLERHGGGKGANAAVASARAGARVALVGAVGDDDFGQGAVAELRAEGIDCAGVSVLAGQATGVAAITVDAEGENQIAVASGANQALQGIAVRRALEAVRPELSTVLLLSFELADEPLEAAAGWARERELATVVLNPAPARPLSAVLLGAHPVLTPNAGELASLSGGGKIDAAARALSARSDSPVIVTLGRDGALVADEHGSETIAAPRVQALDSTGAGDAFNGALAAALAQGHELRAAAARAAAAASASVTGRGARGGMPSQGEIDRLSGA